MSPCNSCIPEDTNDGITFQASSPDELALLEAAREMGSLLRSRDNESISLALSSSTSIAPKTEDYKVLDIIDFSTDRRRMSIIVRFSDRRICVFCKGAESVIFERLKKAVATKTDDDESSGYQKRDYATNDIKKCMQSVDKFAKEGLRTLLFAYRFLKEEEYAEWRKTWKSVDRSLVDQQRMIETAQELVEVDLELAGATTIEDKLQRGVPGLIEKLSRANIKIWMLTGEKRETAINIGRSCGLIKEHLTISILSIENDSVDLEAAMSSIMFTARLVAQTVLVINGLTLAKICERSSGVLEAMFFELAIISDAVVCNRAQPSQKAQLVNGVRRQVPRSVTLAIGDGANDIAKIQEAHVGIRIIGKEGLQAAHSSDYSLAQFRFTPKLLLVHGRWYYIRTCSYALGTLWKEVVFMLTQALFQRWNGFTDTSLYEPRSLSMYNTLFTSLPVLVIGIFEKDFPASILLAVPELYRTMGQRNGALNIWIYCGWTIMAVADSMVVFFCTLFFFGRADREADNTLYAMGDLTFVAVIIVVSMKLQIIEMHDKSATALMSVFLCAGAAFLWNILHAATYPRTTMYTVRGEFFDGFGKNRRWWFTLLLSVTCVSYSIALSAFVNGRSSQHRDMLTES